MASSRLWLLSVTASHQTREPEHQGPTIRVCVLVNFQAVRPREVAAAAEFAAWNWPAMPSPRVSRPRIQLLADALPSCRASCDGVAIPAIELSAGSHRRPQLKPSPAILMSPAERRSEAAPASAVGESSNKPAPGPCWWPHSTPSFCGRRLPPLNRGPACLQTLLFCSWSCGLLHRQRFSILLLQGQSSIRRQDSHWQYRLW
mmetsp:Transcript_15064/g.32145  ORF Transcript_15064/g.32145 Transcript_15064/m.32145 type:complete len:202 (+) Transcript_15064:1158-1763(+)